ncbi:MAG: hypothetical protein WC867_07065 [Candidatus Pacearchaeota archaeon]|jgi:hypothetical protein
MNRIKGRYYLVIGLFYLFFLLNSVIIAQDVETGMNVTVSPPILIQLIPNFTWETNQNLTNAFCLDDYFKDPSGFSLNYTFTSVPNILVVINSTTNNVSFYPDFGFMGIRNITFYATNDMGTTPSNPVTLFVNLDDEAPKWKNPGKNKVNVYQNDYVNFTTTWTDNYQLQGYTFYLRQQGAWVSTPGSFSGIENISRASAQIVSIPGNFIYWYFCANDTSANSNCTDLYSFNVSVPPVVDNPPSVSPPSSGATSPPPATTTPPATGAAVVQSEAKKKIKDFLVEPSFFKISMKQASVDTRILKITNIGNTEIFINLSLLGVEDFVVLSENSFNLTNGEVKKITVDFITKNNTVPDQYFGRIIVSSSQIQEVPVIIDVNPINQKFSVDVNISEKYKVVKPGEMVQANIIIKNIKDITPTNVKLHIAIKDFSGTIYDSYEEDILFDDTLNLIRNITVPSNTIVGEYLFYARIYDENNIAIDSDSFQVGTRYLLAVYFKKYFLFILLLFLFILTIFLILRYKKEREKERTLTLYLMLTELKNLIKDGKFDKAVQLYIRIKTIYGEPVSRASIKDKEKLKEEIEKLSNKLKGELETAKEANSDKEKSDTKKSEDIKEVNKEETIVKNEEKKESENEVKNEEKTK